MQDFLERESRGSTRRAGLKPNLSRAVDGARPGIMAQHDGDRNACVLDPLERE